ncbi:hypothetical protein GUJ93_ZPchr0007g4928 [Zizania palustris]|uniref:Uncharacterized protein n=1 Tax=Zizania palustris TaxID=103762 RepID=A0A8J5VPX8_ZIZPA|nr:hypothetical protein GUJ93_ZPchr0007g4928 [Zizania palustris]
MVERNTRRQLRARRRQWSTKQRRRLAVGQRQRSATRDGDAWGACGLPSPMVVDGGTGSSRSVIHSFVAPCCSQLL